jgi:predicted aspartyl protease/Flp pilus assembly protein TadD
MADSQDSLGDSAVLSSLTIGAHMTVVLRLTPLSVGSVVFISFALTSHAQSQSQGPAPTPVASSGSAHVIAPAPALGPGPLSDAMALYRKGDFDSAIQKYRDVLQSDPKAAGAYAGLTRVYLKRKDVQEASDTISKALRVADDPTLHVALGEVYFRQGKIHDAEVEWAKVINSGRPDARAYLGLARVRWALSMYKTGQTMIEKAHTLDPSDPEIRTPWSAKLSRAERLKFLEDYLASENNEDAETRAAMQHYLEYLKARAKDPRGACHLASKTTTTETPMVRLLVDANHLRGYGLTVEVNGHKTKLMLDTGASGILINRSLAERAGVTRLADLGIGGIGDKGATNGHRALASSLKVGDLEFQNCPIEVLEKRSVVGEDGLIGADVFSSFLVDIDFPNEKLRLKELPKRPDEVAATVNLRTDEADSENDEPPAKDAAATQSVKDATATRSGPRDRYIAPEMTGYTQVLRFGHFLLVPTKIANVPGKLFMLDTGAFSSHITPAAAREITRLYGDDNTTVKGISGSVKDVFRADKAVLQFGHLRQENQDMVAFDLTHLSDDVGTEISGTLGFTTLRFLDIKIDYRDGLVDFSYDPTRWGR